MEQAVFWAALGSYGVGYLYILAVTAGGRWLAWMAAFALALCAGAGFYLRDEKPRGECWVWLGCLWACLLGSLFGLNRVWDEFQTALILHGFGAYWLLTRVGRCMGGGSSRYTPLDLAHGLVVVPFGNLLLRVHVLWRALTQSRRAKWPLAAWLGAVGATIIAALGLGLAGTLLSQADANFERLTSGLWTWLERLDGTYFVDFILSLPVGAYLYGLVVGGRMESPERANERRGRVDAAVHALRQVPPGVWPVLIGLFNALYMVFFVVQGSYLFDGLRGVLPEAFTAAEYARRGFFELCGVMAVNFALLGAAAVSARGGLRNPSGASRHLPFQGRQGDEDIAPTGDDGGPGDVEIAPTGDDGGLGDTEITPTAATGVVRRAAALLLIQSALFAVTAGAKLLMYIQRFGFTPLRLQSAWLVTVLFAGCLAALTALFTGKGTTRAFMAFAGVTLAGTML